MAKRRLPKYLEREGVHRMMTAIEGGYHIKRNRALIWMFYTTGLRLVEMEQVNIEDIIKNGNIRTSFYLIGKGNKERVVYLPARTRDLIMDYLNEGDRVNDWGPLFIHNKGRFMGRGIRELIRRIGERAGVTIRTDEGRKPPTTHTFRHSYAVNLLKNGVDIVKVQQLLGHTDLKTTLIYTQLSNDDLIESLDKVEW
jgi:site-specific recombinase XerD